MELITRDDFSQATYLSKFKLGLLAKPIMRFTNINKINSVYSSLSHKQGPEFISSALDALNVSYEIDEYSKKNIPASGPFIVVSNHPFGGVDALVLLDIISSKVPDFKLLDNFLVRPVDTLEKYFYKDSLLQKDELSSSVLDDRSHTLQLLEEGNGVGFFPAGEASFFQKRKRKVKDNNWDENIMKLIMRAGVKVIPVYIEGRNSLLYHLMGMINPKLRKLRLPSEFFNKKSKPVKVRIGQAIRPQELKPFTNTGELRDYLRAKTYVLGSAKPNKQVTVSLKGQVPVAAENATSAIEKEIAAVSKKSLIFSQQNFDVFITKPKKIPTILNEIGRLREITFRQVGEGTNKSIDLDEYDKYYHQLFVWDRDAKKLVGGYRMGKGGRIVYKKGIRGFYISSLFKFKSEFSSTLLQSIELGRSFITKEYQQHRLPLFLLWKGILHFLLSNPEYKYLIGPVSISNDYSKVSRSLLIKHIQENYFDNEIAKQIKPRKKYRVKLRNEDLKILLEKAGKDLKSLNKLLQDIEPGHMGVPILLKKYISQNARIIGFNVDPKFSNALDGLMVLKVDDLPESTYTDYSIELKNKAK